MSEPRSATGRDRVVVVGIGDDGPAGLTPRAYEAVAGAELLCGGHRQLALVPEHPAERVAVTADVDGLVSRLQAEIGRRRIVVLASGDPCFFGIGPILKRRLCPTPVDIIPGVGVVSLAFARLGESWQDARVVSAHGRDLDGAIRRAHGANKLLFLTDKDNTPAAIARRMLDVGLEDAEAWVFEHLGGPGEKQFRGRLSEVTGQTFAELNVLVVPSARWPWRDHGFGRDESAFLHARGQVTKAEVRAVALSKLRLPREGTLWDVGAGSGSVGIEAAGLLRGGAVFAVERDPEQLALLRQNVSRWAPAHAVKIVPGEAPAALVDLPSPDAVFVGGSGGCLEPILDVCYDRLSPGGRLVVNLATVEHLAAATTWGARRGVRAEIVQISVSRGAEIRGLTRLEAQNPVSIVAFDRAP